MVINLGLALIVLRTTRPWRAFLETPEEFSGPKVIFEIQSLSSCGEVFNPKISAKFLDELRFYCLAFKTNEN